MQVHLINSIYHLVLFEDDKPYATIFFDKFIFTTTSVKLYLSHHLSCCFHTKIHSGKVLKEIQKLIDDEISKSDSSGQNNVS